MSIQKLEDLPNVTGVGANQTVTIGIPVGGPKYELIGFDMSGTTFTKAMISNLELLVNGKAVQSFKDITQLELISAYYGRNVAANEVVLPFYKEEFLDSAEAEIFDIGTADLSTLQMRFDIGAATAPAVAAFAKKTIDPNAALNTLGLFTKVKKFVFSATGAGTLEIDRIPREAWAQAIHLIPSADVITDVTVVIDGQEVWKADTTRMTNVVERAGRTRQATVYHIDWMLRNELGGQIVLDKAQDFRLRVGVSGAATIDTYVEYLSSFAGI